MLCTNTLIVQISFVASGKFKVTVDGKTKVLVTNDTFYIPPDVEHEAIGLEEGVLISAISPVREDFLAGKSRYER